MQFHIVDRNIFLINFVLLVFLIYQNVFKYWERERREREIIRSYSFADRKVPVLKIWDEVFIKKRF